MMRRLLRAVFYTGRHHKHTAPRPYNGELLTVWEIAAKLRREAQRPIGTASVVIEPDAWAFDGYLRRALIDLFANPEQVAPEQLGAMSV